MYVLLVLCLNAVFMQVVSYCSVRVVPGVTLVAGWRWPGPLPWLLVCWSCSVCSVGRQARPSAQCAAAAVTHYIQWHTHRDQGLITPDQCQGSAVVRVVTCSTSCTSVVVWPSAGWCRPAAAAWPQQNFIHTQLYSLQSTQAHTTHCLPASSSRAS